MTRASRTRIASASVALASLALQPARVAAQVRALGGATDSIPRALADAMLDQMGTMRAASGGRPRLVVGAVPTGLALRLWIPQGGSVLGGIESSRLIVAVIHSALPQDSLIAGYRREQVRRGWSPPNSAGGATFGFVRPSPTALSPDGTGGAVFCSGETTLTITVAPAEQGMSEVRATAVNGGIDVCRPAMTRPAVMPSPDYPTLVNPPGSVDGFPPGCPAWNYANGGGTTRIQNLMPLDSILAYYGKQLADAGFAGAAGETVTRSWIRRESAEKTTELTLLARSENGCVELRMEVRGRR